MAAIYVSLYGMWRVICGVDSAPTCVLILAAGFKSVLSFTAVPRDETVFDTATSTDAVHDSGSRGCSFTKSVHH